MHFNNLIRKETMNTKKLRVAVVKFEDDEYEEGETAIRVVEFDGVDWGEMNGQVWGEYYNKTHDRKIESAKFYSLDYLKDHWETVQ